MTEIWVPSRLADLLDWQAAAAGTAPVADGLGGVALVDIATQAELNAVSAADEKIANKDAANGYPGLDNSSLLKLTEFPRGALPPFAYLAASYYGPGAPVVTNQGMAANGNIRLVPIWLPTRAVDRIGLVLTVAGSSGSLVRLGIYGSDPSTGMPTGSPLVDAGTIDGTSATYQEKTIAWTPSARGYYWLAAVVQAASAGLPSCHAISQSSIFGDEGMPLTSSSAGSGGIGVNGFASGALGDITGQTFIAVGPPPRVIVRLT